MLNCLRQESCVCQTDLRIKRLSELFLLHQFERSAEAKEDGQWSWGGGKGRTQNKRDVIFLPSIACTHDHTWDLSIICFHFLASFQFLPHFLLFFLLIFSLLIPLQLKQLYWLAIV